jgi:membrane protease YdiL (CAAX protease family)
MKRGVGIVRIAVAFEAALGLLGGALAWWLSVPLATRTQPSWAATFRGLWATAPMLAALAWLTKSQWPPIADLRTTVSQLLEELFHRAGCIHLAAVAVAAGVGEELLFRGALQGWAVQGCGAVAGVVLTSLVFGLFHALTPIYLVLATVVGLYLGWLAHAFADLTAPMIAHALYDFIALRVLLARRGAGCAQETSAVIPGRDA